MANRLPFAPDQHEGADSERRQRRCPGGADGIDMGLVDVNPLLPWGIQDFLMPFVRGAQVDRELARLAGFKARHPPPGRIVESTGRAPCAAKHAMDQAACPIQHGLQKKKRALTPRSSALSPSGSRFSIGIRSNTRRKSGLRMDGSPGYYCTLLRPATSRSSRPFFGTWASTTPEWHSPGLGVSRLTPADRCCFRMSL